MRPTAEQQVAVDLFKSGGHLAIEAGAGTGKTSTLVLIAQGTTRRGQYVAFNKAIVNDSAARFPDTVRCNTAHSLAFRAVGREFKGRLDRSQRLKSYELAAILRIDPINVTAWDGQRKQLSAGFLAGHVMAAIERFCQSADPEPNRRHVGYIKGLDSPPLAERPTVTAVNMEVAHSLEPAMRRAWADLCRYEGALPYRHSHYLKAWQLSKPTIYADYVLFDEAQDASPVMNAVVSGQRDSQIVWVGDSQQEIYGWAGAVNALAAVPADKRTFLTQSFRFGPDIADLANSILGALRAPLRLTGSDAVQSRVVEIRRPDAILCRTNATSVRRVLDAQRDGLRPHLVGDGSEVASFARAAERLKAGQRVEHPDLACFDTWGEVQEYVEQDALGGELRLLVGLIDEFGVPLILKALDGQIAERHADVVVSTAHKAKGREWGKVKLADDFSDEPSDEELRLLYVASTRARYELDVSSVPWFLGHQLELDDPESMEEVA